jgi:hypothetical protein
MTSTFDQLKTWLNNRDASVLGQLKKYEDDFAKLKAELEQMTKYRDEGVRIFRELEEQFEACKRELLRDLDNQLTKNKKLEAELAEANSRLANFVKLADDMKSKVPTPTPAPTKKPAGYCHCLPLRKKGCDVPFYCCECTANRGILVRGSSKYLCPECPHFSLDVTKGCVCDKHNIRMVLVDIDYTEGDFHD